jgi:hypothetical protein
MDNMHGFTLMDGKDLAELPLDMLAGDAVVLDLRDPAIQVGQMQKAAENLEKLTLETAPFTTRGTYDIRRTNDCRLTSYFNHKDHCTHPRMTSLPSRTWPILAGRQNPGGGIGPACHRARSGGFRSR